MDVSNIGFIFFIDTPGPEFMATRTKDELGRIGEARADWSGPLVTVQHTSLFPPGLTDCPYNLTNAQEIAEEHKKHHVCLALSGHWHPGFQVEKDGCHYISCPALGKNPFQFCEIVVEEGKIEQKIYGLLR